MIIYERESLFCFSGSSCSASLLAHFHWVWFGCQVQCGSKLLENISRKARFPNPGLPVDHIYGCNCKQLPTHQVTVREVVLKMVKNSKPWEQPVHLLIQKCLPPRTVFWRYTLVNSKKMHSGLAQWLTSEIKNNNYSSYLLFTVCDPSALSFIHLRTLLILITLWGEYCPVLWKRKQSLTWWSFWGMIFWREGPLLFWVVSHSVRLEF